MKPFEIAGYLAYSRTTLHQRRLERARGTIKEALALCQRPYVAFSAGKDSEALLWMVREQTQNIQIRLLTGGETRILHPAIDTILAWWKARGADIEEIHIDHIFADGWQEIGFWEQYETFIGEWKRYLLPEGADGVFMGLRAEESNRRRNALRLREENTIYSIYRYRHESINHPANIYRICPLDQWSVRDVAAIIAQHDIPLLDSYEFSGIDARTHDRIGRIAMRCGQLDELRRRDPQGYNKLIQRFPELLREMDNQVI